MMMKGNKSARSMKWIGDVKRGFGARAGSILRPLINITSMGLNARPRMN